MHILPRRRHIAVASLLALLVTGAVAAPASAQSPDDVVVASGPAWTVERAAGGYTVTLRLEEPLPIVSDAPTIIVDGEPIGIARTEDGGRTLTVTTFDDRVATAQEVEKGWASGSGPKAGEDGADDSGQRRAPDPENDMLKRQLDALAPADPVIDPAEPGPYTVTEAEYDFGDAAIDLAGYRDARGEMVGKIYLSSASGPRPVVVLEHGRHATCGDAVSGEATADWPCPSAQMQIRSYLGYEGTGRALASHGYNVVSISANAINATDSEFTLDQGAQARGRLVLDTLDMLDRLARGEGVSYEDRPEGQDAVTRTFDDALERATSRADQPAPPSGVTAADLDGRFDLDRVGLMGHSRGGEGVVSAAQLNAAADDRYGILAVLPLAPTDFARRTLSDVTTLAVLPYCDGDVSDQQGQKYIDDSRRAFGDDVLRSAMWVMGANHNFFSSVWTPGEYPVGGADDWNPEDTTSSCATVDSTRLSAAEQYQVGVSYMTGFFRLTLGGEERFRPLFDGSVAPSTTLTPFADVRVMATQPRSDTDLITDFAGKGARVSVEGAAVATPCEGSMPTASEPSCSSHWGGAVPHWNPAFLAPFVPLFPATRLEWTEASGASLHVSLAAEQRDVRDRVQLTLKAAPGDDVALGTEFSVKLVDGSGAEFSVSASSLNPYAVNRLPGGAFGLDKVVLQQITLPLDRVVDIDLSDVREVVLEPGIGADASASGSLLLSDLAFDSPSAGDPDPVARPAVSVAETRVEEGSEPRTAAIAVWLDRAWDEPVSAFVSTNPGSGGEAPPAGLGGERFTFAPGQTCLPVPVLIVGNTDPSAAGVSVAGTAATTGRGAVSGSGDFADIVVREDDGVQGDDAAPVPAFGVQGDVCAELAAARTPGTLEVSDAEPRRGDTLRLTATGFRVGEAVLAQIAGAALPWVIADADGTAVIETTIAADAALGATSVRAEGAGSARVQQASVRIGASVPTPTPTPTTSPAPSPSVTTTPVVADSRAGGTLARSGVDGALWLAVALGAALTAAAGGAVTVEARRRRGR